MAPRVLSTEQAKTAIQPVQAIINGGLTEQISRLDGQGKILSNPDVWDGPLAQQFRDQTWRRKVGARKAHTDDALSRREGHLIPVRHELNLPLHAHPELAAELSSALAAGRDYPIMRVVDALGLGDRLLSRQALAAGSLWPGEVVSPRKDHVTATASYAKCLPQEVIELLG